MKQPINNVSVEDAENFRTAIDYDGSNALDHYQELAVRSAIYPLKGTPFGLMYVALGLSEAGEAQNKIKKIFRDDGVLETLHKEDFGIDHEDVHVVRFNPISDERRGQVTKELGGLLWYVAACCQELGIKASDVAAANLLELAGRAQRGTLAGSGDDR